MPPMLEVTCPMCGGIVVASNIDRLVELTQLHTLDAHDYTVPKRHVVDLATPIELD